MFRAKSVLFATGGYGRMFRVSSNAHALTGDGPSVAFRRGIPLEDMEFFQFHPTGLYRLGVLLSEGARGEGGDPAEPRRRAVHGALRPDDQGPRARATSCRARSTRRSRRAEVSGPKGDYAPPRPHPPRPRACSRRSCPDITEFARVYLQVEPTREPVPIQPTAHYAMGGIPTDVHGARRHGRRRDARARSLRRGRVRLRLASTGRTGSGTNSLLDIVVFGRRGGDDMARHCAETRPARSAAGRHRATPSTCSTGSSPGRRATTSPTSGRSCRTRCSTSRSWSGPRRVSRRWARSSAGSGSGTTRIAIGDKGSVYNTDLMEAVEVGFLLDCAATLVAAAQARDESRGAHYREDHPLRDDANWLKHSLAYRQEDGSIRLDTKPVKMGPYIPMERKY